MAFMIRFLEEDKKHPKKRDPKIRMGEIIMGQDSERFEASLMFWSVEDYQRHWKQAIERIVSGEEKSCLITSMYNPEYANFIRWRPLYRKGDTVFMLSQILFLEEQPQPFKLSDPFASVIDYETATDTDDDFEIAEWEIPLSELEDFLKKTAETGF